jgi:hypothetical protein
MIIFLCYSRSAKFNEDKQKSQYITMNTIANVVV